MNILYIHAHLIIDDTRQYLDGAMLVDDRHILKVFPHSQVGDYDAKIVDLAGKLIFPSFFNSALLDDYQTVVDPLNPYSSNKKIVLGNTKAYMKDINIEYDGYYDLFSNMTGFDAYNFGLVNAALGDDKYVEVSSSLDESILNVVYKVKRVDKIILIGDVLTGIKKLYRLGANYNELLMMGCLNARMFFGLDKKEGSLVQGKSSKIEILGSLDV